MRRRLIMALCLCALALPALAQNGRTPIPFAAPVVTPIIIQQPGSYVVTRNLQATGPGPIIDIQVPFSPGGDVTIDLNGMILDNQLNFNAPVIRIQVFGSAEVTLRNGTLIGGSAGIEAFGPGRKLVVEDVKISDFSGAAHLGGIHVLDFFNTIIRRCVIMDAVPAGFQPAGIFLDGGIPRQATIEDNHIQNTYDGVDATPNLTAKISNNRFENIQSGGVFGAAIHLDFDEACLISENTIRGVGGVPGAGVGIRLNGTQGCKVYNNVITGTQSHGIHLFNGASGTLVLNNVVRRAGGEGILIDGQQNHIDRNVLTSNQGYGLRFATALVVPDNTYGRNTAAGNLAATPPCLAPPWSAELCDDNAPPPISPNVSFGDNLMPGPLGPI